MFACVVGRSVALGARHRPISTVLFLALVVCCERNVAAQAMNGAQNQNAQNIAPAMAAFSEIFNRVWQASSEYEPFQSIHGDYDPGSPGWFATAILPGAYQCHVYKPGGGRMRAGTDSEDAIYDCNFQVRPEDNERYFEEMVHSIRSLLPKMEVREPPPLPRPRVSGRWGVTYHQLGGRSIVMTLRSDESEAKRYLRALCFQPRVVTISWSNSTRIWYAAGTWHESEPIAGLYLRLSPAATFPRDQANYCPAPYLTERSAKE